jgi:hypothetical protein
MLYYTVYLSDASSALNQEKNDILLDQLRLGDRGHELSGMIACIKGVSVNGLKGLCVQVFEGPKYVVQEAITILELDPNRECEWIYSGETIFRNFSGLNSAYEYLNLDLYPAFYEIFELNLEALKAAPREGAEVLISFLKKFLKDAKKK